MKEAGQDQANMTTGQLGMASSDSGLNRTNYDSVPEDIRPGRYFRTESGKIMKIKEVEQGIFIIDDNGKEKRMDPSQLRRFIDYQGYKVINVDTAVKQEVMKLMESDISTETLIDILGNE